ncbi:MAG: glycosyltransferase [Anaerolineae bacterium]|nr:glycosyltransferase [Anaerolineae bacterium]
MLVSLIMTVLNEGESIRALLESLTVQTRLPDEIVVCDGGSTDGTRAVIDEYGTRLPLRVVVQQGANISEGRNRAIREAAYPIVAVTDAGVRLDPGWLEQLIAPLGADPRVMGVAGFFLPDAHTPFEVAMGATVLPEREEIDPVRFMPSSRSVAFRREAFERAGGYPEWLDYCEDLVFDFRFAALHGPFSFVPDAVAHFRPRSSLRAFWKQYYLYARGDGKAGLFLRRHLIRYLAYLALLPLILLSAVWFSPWWLILLAVGGLLMVARPYRRLLHQWHGLTAQEKLIALAWVPMIRLAGDLAKIAGYPPGVVWRFRHTPPDWHIR